MTTWRAVLGAAEAKDVAAKSSMQRAITTRRFETDERLTRNMSVLLQRMCGFSSTPLPQPSRRERGIRQCIRVQQQVNPAFTTSLQWNIELDNNADQEVDTSEGERAIAWTKVMANTPVTRHLAACRRERKRADFFPLR